MLTVWLGLADREEKEGCVDTWWRKKIVRAWMDWGRIRKSVGLEIESGACCVRCQRSLVFLNLALFVFLSHTHMHINIHKYTNTYTATIESWPLVSVCGSIWKWTLANAAIDFTLPSLWPSSPLVVHPTPLSLLLLPVVRQTSRMWGPTHWHEWLNEWWVNVN